MLLDETASERPPGNVPEAKLHVNVPVAVVEAVRAREYEIPTVPEGAEVGMIERGGIAAGLIIKL